MKKLEIILEHADSEMSYDMIALLADCSVAYVKRVIKAHESQK